MTEDTLFAAVLAKKDPVERAAYLAQMCGDDAALRQRLEARLLARDEASTRLQLSDDWAQTSAQTPCPQQESTTFGDTETVPPKEQLGRAIGPYRLLEKLGEGGMGMVFLAEQTEPIQRRVALKVIKAGMDSAQVLARFEAERQALARMEHPHIARVLDAGRTPEGRPYFVMELVQGVPLTRYCDQERLNLRQRLELFVLVCRAVQHAHQKGIIHRDLKPSNVLVARYDGKAAPKVIDFGIAKAIEQKLGQATIATEAGQILGTVEYMAPEQAELNNLDIDTRADIYSLGVLLYEMLTGSPPFPRQKLRQLAFTEMLRTIREVEPPRPSTKLSSSQELAAIAARRKLEPKRLTKLLRGELDWIVMKCLEKDRARRYETANGLAQDVERYLNDEPVEAGPPSTLYRLRKFVRRHKGPVVTATLVLLALVGGIVGTSLGLWEARRQRIAADDSAAKSQQAEAAARGAETEARTVLTFFQDKVLAAARPKEQEGGLGVDASIQAAVDAAEPKIADAFREQPRVEAEIRHALGLTYLYLAQPRQAIRQYERAVELRKSYLGPDHPETLASMNNLSWAYQDAGRLQDARTLAEDTLARRKATLGPDHPDTLDSMNKLALIWMEAGRQKETEELLLQTLQLRQAKLGPDDPGTLKTQNDLALLYRFMNRLKDAIPLYKEARKGREAVLGPNHPDTLQTMHNLATAYKFDGRFDDALTLLKETYQRKKQRLGPTHRDTVTTLALMGQTYLEMGRLADALPLLEQTLEARKVSEGPNHRLTLVSMSDLTLAYKDAGRLKEAVKLGEETLKRRQVAQGKESPDTLTSMNALALVYQAAGRLPEAAPLFAETLRLQIAQRGPDHPYSFITANSLAGVYRDLNRLNDAVKFSEEATMRARKYYPAGDVRRLRFVETLASIYDRRNQPEKSEPLLRESLTIRQQKQPDAWPTFDMQWRLGANLLAQKKYADAEPLLVQGYEGMEARAAKIPPQGKGRLTEALQRVVKLYEAWGKKDKADEWRKKLEAAKK